jgi:hypothetical protein
MKGKVNKMLMEADWISTLVGRDEIKVTSFQLTKYDLQPHTRTPRYGCFIDENADMNNSRGRKRTYPSVGLRATISWTKMTSPDNSELTSVEYRSKTFVQQKV